MAGGPNPIPIPPGYYEAIKAAWLGLSAEIVLAQHDEHQIVVADRIKYNIWLDTVGQGVGLEVVYNYVNTSEQLV